MIFHLDSNKVSVRTTAKGFRLSTGSGINLLLEHVTLKETRDVVTGNYGIVKAFYSKRAGDKIAASDLEVVSLKIVLHYFYMHQLWRATQKKKKDRDLAFILKDLEHPSTTDEIISHFKLNYPKDYTSRCKIMLGMTTAQIKAHEKSRQLFYDLR